MEQIIQAGKIISAIPAFSPGLLFYINALSYRYEGKKDRDQLQGV